MIYCFDIDGVIATLTGGEYEKAEPIVKTIRHIQLLHKWGNKIILWTARGGRTGKDWRQLTLKQMADWGVPYDEIWFDKPSADYYIDDKMLVMDFN